MKEIWRMIDFIPELRKDQYMVSSDLNLEWVTRQENQKHKFDVLGLNKHTSRPVKCLTTNKIYSSALEAERQTGIDHSWIARSCNKGRLTKGLSWEYYKD